MWIRSLQTSMPRVIWQLEVVGDIGTVLRFLATLPALPHTWDLVAIGERRQRLFSYPHGATPDAVALTGVGAIQELLPADGFLTCDVGAHTHLIGQAWRTSAPGHLVHDQWLVVDGLWDSGGPRHEALSSREAGRLCHG